MKDSLGWMLGIGTIAFVVVALLLGIWGVARETIQNWNIYRLGLRLVKVGHPVGIAYVAQVKQRWGRRTIRFVHVAGVSLLTAYMFVNVSPEETFWGYWMGAALCNAIAYFLGFIEHKCETMEIAPKI
jgi:hypothetical protein